MHLRIHIQGAGSIGFIRLALINEPIKILLVEGDPPFSNADHRQFSFPGELTNRPAV
jgi:hypothetical protein